MQIPAGLRAPECESAGFIRLEFDLFNLVPIRMDDVVIVILTA
jgi:hypothetical protein